MHSKLYKPVIELLYSNNNIGPQNPAVQTIPSKITAEGCHRTGWDGW